MKMCPESRIYIIGNVAFQWMEMMMNVVMTFIIADLIEDIFQGVEIARAAGRTGLLVSGIPGQSGSMLGQAAITEYVLSAIILILTILTRFFTAKMTAQMSYMASKTVKRILREQIYGKILRLGNSYREHSSTAELVQESVEGVDQLESYFGLYVPQFFYAFIAPITLFVIFVMSGSIRVAAILLVCVPLIPGSIIVVQKIAKRLLGKYWDQYAKLGSTFLENLQGMTTLKIYLADEYKNNQMNEESENFRRVTMKVLTMQLNSIIIMDFFAYGGAALGIAVAAKEFLDGKIGLEPAILMILLSAEFFLPMRKLGSYFHVAMNGMAASDRIFKFLGEEEPPVRTETLPETGLDIKLSDVTFSYDGEKEVLSHVNIDIPEGSFTGIVGESGSGKSTIASLIMGRNTVKNGEVTIAGKRVCELNEENLLKNFNYIGLGSVFFKDTVRENLLIADRTATDERLWEVLEECNIAEFFKSEEGLDTALTENAGNLSGGQRQRLALARAVLHSPKVFIFDEATSNIDVESEEIILDRIHKLSETDTVIMITHRLFNVKNADRIYCLEDGKIAGFGKHEELIGSCAEYKHLWETQKELEAFGKEGM